ncbi:uncharacterized protein LOC107366751 [Tetranychus urticae]|uniref:uncharacterized protein LOC107366751 n=1 Tax=Tetranychus urticae TaxID=32264 RepID=UPI00077BC008|nr:uncharacterized protein LOC107366751 [Tetranychus urticae]
MLPLDSKDKKHLQIQYQEYYTYQPNIDLNIVRKVKKDNRDKEKERIARLKREYKQDLSRSKRAKYSSASLSVNRVFRDLKSLAKKHLNNVQASFDHILLYKFAGSAFFSGFEKLK